MENLTCGGRDLHIPCGPTFFPTVEEFEGSPLHYINKIRPIAEKYGICKIKPPKGWDPPFSVNMDETEKKFSTKEQLLHRIQEGISFGDGEEYCIRDYIQMAVEKTRLWIEDHVKDKETGEAMQTVTPEYLEQCYWDLVEISHEKYEVEYGNDVDSEMFGSGFPRSERGRGVSPSSTVSDTRSNKSANVADKASNKGVSNRNEIVILDSDEEDDDFETTNNTNAETKSNHSKQDQKDLPEPKFGTEEFYKESYWNLNNIPNAPDSILQHIKVGINGINVPWMYFGNLFSSFCWHNEDNYLYSINYHHWGAPKLWYGIPGTKKDAAGLEQVFKSYLSMKMRDVPDLLHHITTMFSPRLLQTADVPVCKLIQHPGEFVVTFPRAFHGGFSMGPNAGEAVNFATHDWIVHGADASERYRSFARPAVFSHDRLTFTMANHLQEQKSHHTCKLLTEELKRVIREEMSLRKKLFDAGVRDVSGFIDLPQNRLDQLDEESADYDDKRLCHSCKHICFFSCVACECSQSKVSCLRHSHYMCRCPTEKKYMMVWSTEKEMNDAYKEVESFAEKLKPVLQQDESDLASEEGTDEVAVRGEGSSESQKKDQIEQNSTASATKEDEKVTEFLIAPGAAQDAENYESYVVDLRKDSSLSILPRKGQRLLDFIRRNTLTLKRPNEEGSHMSSEKKSKLTSDDAQSQNEVIADGDISQDVETVNIDKQYSSKVPEEGIDRSNS